VSQPSSFRLVLAVAITWLVAIASAASAGAGDISYTDEQSARGEAMYTKACAPCHDDKSLAPLLVGDPFLNNWSDKTVGALIEKIHATMPLQDPGSLTEQQAVDLAAYILKMNRFPAGQDGLSKDSAAAATIGPPK